MRRSPIGITGIYYSRAKAGEVAPSPVRRELCPCSPGRSHIYAGCDEQTPPFPTGQADRPGDYRNIRSGNLGLAIP